MAKDYSEDQLIQRSTAELLEKELGWKIEKLGSVLSLRVWLRNPPDPF